MKLKRIGKTNATLIHKPNGVELLVSYSTVVACHIPGEGYYVTSTKHSPTTSKHIGKWLRSNNAIMPKERDQSWFDNLM